MHPRRLTTFWPAAKTRRAQYVLSISAPCAGVPDIEVSRLRSTLCAVRQADCILPPRLSAAKTS